MMLQIEFLLVFYVQLYHTTCFSQSHSILSFYVYLSKQLLIFLLNNLMKLWFLSSFQMLAKVQGIQLSSKSNYTSSVEQVQLFIVGIHSYKL